VVEGTSLLRKHTGLNLYRGFESLALRQKIKAPAKGLLFFEKPTHYNLAYNGKYFSLRIFNHARFTIK